MVFEPFWVWDILHRAYSMSTIHLPVCGLVVVGSIFPKPPQVPICVYVQTACGEGMDIVGNDVDGEWRSDLLG